MEFVNIINSEGKEEMRMIYKPYVYANVIDCSRHCVVFENRKAKAIVKENKHEKGKI